MPGNFCSIPKAHFLHVLLADAPTDSEYVETMQSTPMGCEENRHSGIAINGILKGFYGDRVVDQMATTTITGLENQSWVSRIF